MVDTRIPYDKSSVIWSPDSDLVQLAYARRACERGQPAVGLILDNNTILLAGRKRVDELVELDSKINAIDIGLFFLPSGLISDSNYLLNQARLLSQQHTLINGEIIGPEALASQLGDIMAKHTISGGLRVFGTSVIIAGFDPGNKKPKLLALDNGGSFVSTKAHAYGQDADKIYAFFREHYRTNLSVEAGKKLASDAINFSIPDQNHKLEEKDIDFQIIHPIVDEYW